MKRPFVYLVRKRGLGDVLWIEPVIRQLAAQNKKVIVYTKYNILFENYPLKNVFFKDDLSPFEKICWKIESALGVSLFFINLEMAYERSPKMHFLHAYQLKAGLSKTNEYPHIYFDEKEKVSKLSNDKKYVILHLESLTDKNYRKVYGIDWAKVISYLGGKGFSVIQIGREDLNFPGAKYTGTSIRQMTLLIKDASFFIGIDSGPSHIAASLNIPALIFFGAVNPDFRHFRDLFKGYFLQQFCEFAGCYHESISVKGPDCRLVGNNGIPKCSLHTSEYVISHIDLLIKKYLDNDPKAG